MGKNYRVLVIDDQEIVCSMIKRSLQLYDIDNVDYAPDGNTGIEMDKKNNYDLITCDITMPGLNGIDTVKEILKTYPDKKIIMITSLGREDLIRESMKLGIRHYLLKPFNAQGLLSKVKDLLKEE